MLETSGDLMFPNVPNDGNKFKGGEGGDDKLKHIGCQTFLLQHKVIISCQVT